MTLIERLRLSFNVQCQSTIDLNNEAADRLEQAEKLIVELESALSQFKSYGNVFGYRRGEANPFDVMNEALTSAKAWKEKVL